MASRAEKFGTVVLTALIVGGITVPAQAAPTPGSRITTVPDAGARPQTAAIPLLPAGLLAIPAPIEIDPVRLLNQQVEAARVEAEVLAERVNELQVEHERTRIAAGWANHYWMQADDQLKAAKVKAAEAASSAYRAAAELPGPLQENSLLRDLQQLAPGQRGAGVSESAAYDLDRATAAELTARTTLDKAKAAETAASDEVTTVTATFTQRDGARLLLEQRLVELQSEAERRLERETAKLRVDYDAGQSNKGLLAHPDARKAVLYALDQLGKPYRFAEEGPTYFDCSGLTQTSYRQTGLLLPRVAKDQYNAYRAKPVALDALLPGDLLFFARDPKDWKSIHHVMIYLGDGKIVHAPKTGDVVKISTVNLGSGSPVDFAVRIIDAIPVPPPAPPTPTPTPTPTSTVTPATSTS